MCRNFIPRMIFIWMATAAAAVLALPISVSATEPAASEQSEYLFYPAPPNPPRLQFLKSYSSALDVSAKKTGFRDFVFGGEDNEGHLIDKPYGVAIHNGAIYVVDTRGGGWAVFDEVRGRSRMVTPSGGGSLQKPINISIADDGTKYITDTGREQVVVFDANDRFLGAFGEPGQFSPVDVAVKDDKLYITDIKHHQIHALDRNSGEILATFSESGSKPGQLYHPTNIAIAPDETLYVVDTSNFRVQQFDLSGKFMRAFGKIGNRPGTFSRPKGIALDQDGHIYVVDAAFENVQILDQEGGALMAFGKSGDERDRVNLPTVVKIDAKSVPYFQKYAAPGFEIEYLVAVASQFGSNKLVLYAYGTLND